MRSWGGELLAAAHLQSAAIDATLRNLEYAESRGLSSHGYVRLPTYISRTLAGGINTSARIHSVSDRAAMTIIDADAAIGAYSAEAGVRLAIAKAQSSGIGLVIARNANHFGAAGYYTHIMAEAGYFGIAMCNTDSVMCAPAGGTPVLGSNPISIAAPTSTGAGPILDMATTEVSQGKIIIARDRGESMPPGWAVDATGLDTTDPKSGLAGALLPSGGPKGFGLAFMVDCLMAIGGAQTSQLVSPLYGDPSAAQNLGHAFLAIATDLVLTPTAYSAKIDGLSDAVHRSGLPNVARPPLVPGEQELARLSKIESWQANPSTLRQLEDISRELSVPIPTGEAGRDSFALDGI